MISIDYLVGKFKGQDSMKSGPVDFFFVAKSTGCIIAGNYKKCGFSLISFLYF